MTLFDPELLQFGVKWSTVKTKAWAGKGVEAKKVSLSLFDPKASRISVDETVCSDAATRPTCFKCQLVQKYSIRAVAVVREVENKVEHCCLKPLLFPP